MNIQIEDASLKFLDDLYNIETQSFKEEAFSKQQIAYLLEDYNSVSLVARIDGDVAGFVIGRIDVERNKTAGHILTLDVALAYRRKGVGRRLLSEIETFFRVSGIRECRLEVSEKNAAALKLYLKLGYQKIAKLENYYPNAHGLYLRKSL